MRWHDAEPALETTDGDVFAIFDCCYAGRVCQYRGDPVRFEILGACSADQVTAPPGPHSFTTALIWALAGLKQLRLQINRSFSTSELRRKIINAPEFPRDQYPLLTHRYNESSFHIIIAPCEEKDPNTTSSDYLDLHKHVSESLTEDQVRKTADAMKELLKKTPHEREKKQPFAPRGKEPKQLFKDGEQVWLRETKDRPNMQVKIIQSRQNSVSRSWEYCVEDMDSVRVMRNKDDGWIAENQLSSDED